jgi:hypothetical protein
MKILLVTKRSQERAYREAKAVIERDVEETTLAWEAAWATFRDDAARRNARRDRLMGAIWLAHDAGLLPAEVDEILVDDWYESRKQEPVQ